MYSSGGGFLLIFGGSRTFHRIACAVEDAGFEIKDCIMWLYGNGFPKSNDVGLKIDKKNNVDNKTGNIITTGTAKSDCIVHVASGNSKIYEERKATNEWGGWGHSLKPAYEPIIVARKPVEGSLIENVQKYRVGAYNIDECRIGEELFQQRQQQQPSKGIYADKILHAKSYVGRFPANVITDGSENVAKGMPINENGCSPMRYFYCAKASTKDRDEGLDIFEKKQITDNSIRKNAESGRMFGANPVLKRNPHPTVKPTELMQYLVRLVAPKGATILDPFMGSGSTGKAVMFENRERQSNYKFIGIEMTKEYLPIAHARIDYAKNKYQYDLVQEKKENEEKGIQNIFDFMEE